MLGKFAKYAFCGLKRKRRDFERSVLKYVSIKIPALTHSGRKSRVCVNVPDRLLHPIHVCLFLPCGHSVSPSGGVGTPARRAARWGRLWGCAPFAAPLASPPKHPQERFQFPQNGEGTRLELRELPSLAPLAQVISLRAA